MSTLWECDRCGRTMRGPDMREPLSLWRDHFGVMLGEFCTRCTREMIVAFTRTTPDGPRQRWEAIRDALAPT